MEFKAREFSNFSPYISFAPGADVSIKLHLCPVLSYYADNKTSVEVSGNTISECLHNLTIQIPALNKFIETPDASRIIHIYINKDDTAIEDLNQSVKDGDEVRLVFFLDG
jgi:molybdopterin converting factor small subunit